MSLPVTTHYAHPAPERPALNLDSQSRARKPRSEKPQIELAPDQPLTTQGKPRARVFVACLQCRTRKIRCDGAKPACHNCTRSIKLAESCTYDATPKRRGPDKTPGARQRMARDAREQRDVDPVASRRRRRKRHDTAPSSQPVQVRPSPTSPPPLVIDPQLVNIPPYQPTSAAQPPDTSLTNLALQPPSLLLDGTVYHTTNSQGPYFPLNFSSQLVLHHPTNSVTTATITRAYISPHHQDNDFDSFKGSPSLPSEPSLEFVRQTWWESLLTVYSSSLPSPIIPISRRQQAANRITNDLRFLFRSSNYAFSFFNVPHFLSVFLNPERRLHMQPSLLPAALAVATFIQSSETGLGRQGRRKALQLRNFAQGALEASLNARWIDEELAQAAWVSEFLHFIAHLTVRKLLALFELCAHPDYTSERTASSMVTLDIIIRALSLTTIDLEDPASATFSPRSVPSVTSASQSWAADSSLSAALADTRFSNPAKGCSCASRSLGQRWAAVQEYTPLWTSTPAWGDCCTEAEIRKESCRRVCWSALLLAAGHTSYATIGKRTPPDLFISEPTNFALLFPGEMMLSSVGHSGKDTIWSLNYRTMLLWHSCLRMRQDPSVSAAELARFGWDAWDEADVLEKALDSHQCDFERTYMFQGRDYLFDVRSMVMHEFRRYAPLVLGGVGHVYHSKARDWLTHQAIVSQRVVQSMAAFTGHASVSLGQRPFFVFWCMGQISRALFLWECDKTLTLALDVCTAFFKPVDFLCALWPCAELRRRLPGIREQLANACREAGRPSPPPCSTILE